jgi:hypothetical protein
MHPAGTACRPDLALPASSLTMLCTAGFFPLPAVATKESPAAAGLGQRLPSFPDRSQHRCIGVQ